MCILHRQTESNHKSTKISICTECNRPSTNITHCDNVDCTQREYYEKSSLQFLYMPMLPQILNILTRVDYLNFKRQGQPACCTNVMKDITDGAAYDRILTDQSQTKFISLLMNVDGIQIAKSSNISLLVISFVINELKRNERFKLENVIIAGVSSSKTKPSQDQMYTILAPVVQELKQLEQDRCFELKASNNHIEPLRIFLLAACLDKSAQALVHNLNEPIAAYGCG